MDSVNSAQALARVCSDMDFITLTCPETEDSIAQNSPMNVVDDKEDDLLGPGSPTLSLELEEREVLTLLESLNDPANNDNLPSPAYSPSTTGTRWRSCLTQATSLHPCP